MTRVASGNQESGCAGAFRCQQCYGVHVVTANYKRVETSWISNGGKKTTSSSSSSSAGEKKDTMLTPLIAIRMMKNGQYY